MQILHYAQYYTVQRVSTCWRLRRPSAHSLYIGDWASFGVCRALCLLDAEEPLHLLLWKANRVFLDVSHAIDHPLGASGFSEHSRGSDQEEQERTPSRGGS